MQHQVSIVVAIVLAAIGSMAQSLDLTIRSQQNTGISTGPAAVAPGGTLPLVIHGFTTADIGALRYDVVMPGADWTLLTRSYAALDWDTEDDDQSVPPEGINDISISQNLHAGDSDLYDFSFDTSVLASQLSYTGDFMTETVTLQMPPTLSEGIHSISLRNVAAQDENGLGLPLTISTISLTVQVVRGSSSATVGAQLRELLVDQTISICSPFDDGLNTAHAQGISPQLARDGADGDWWHVWTGTHFNRYSQSGNGWLIDGTNTSLPTTRLNGDTGAGYMLTAKTAPQSKVLAGAVLADATVSRTVPAESWQMLGTPYPEQRLLAAAFSSGPTEGDRVRLWNFSAQDWEEITFVAGAWSVPSQPVPVGEALLFYNSSASAKTLVFSHP